MYFVSGMWHVLNKSPENKMGTKKALTCLKCHKEGIYYHEKSDLLAQLWYSGKDVIFNSKTIKKNVKHCKRKRDLFEKQNFQDMHWRTEETKRWKLFQKVAINQRFKELYKGDEQVEKQILSRSCRYQEKKRQEGLATTIITILDFLRFFPSVLNVLIKDYLFPIETQYLFVISEVIKMKELSYIEENTEIDDVFFLQQDVQERKYCLEEKVDLQNDFHSRLQKESKSRWVTARVPQRGMHFFRELLLCPDCIQKCPENKKYGLGIHGQLDPKDRKPLSQWTCLFDQELFYYKDPEKYRELYKSYLDGPDFF